MGQPLSAQSLATLFTEARSYNDWSATPITDAEIRAIQAHAMFGPTAANTNPARYVWAVSEEGKARVCAHMSGSNRAKSLKASAVVVVAYDLDFPDQMPVLFPHAPDAKNWFGDLTTREEPALRNSSLQGAYLLLAARALGWDTGPMSGFDNAALDKDLFAGTNIKSNFIVAIGKGTTANLFPRLPRLPFEQANTIL